MNAEPHVNNSSAGTNGQIQLQFPRTLWGRNVSPEAVWIVAICLADLVTTLYWVADRRATEGNPLMATFLHMGVVPFIAAKLHTFVPATILAEWYRSHKPELVTRLLRWVIAGYLFLYVAGVMAHWGQAGEFYRNLLSDFWD